jgi:hypothetical protein
VLFQCPRRRIIRMIEDFGVAPMLLVEDNPGDVILSREVLGEHGLRGEPRVIGDGDIACEFIARLDRGVGTLSRPADPRLESYQAVRA